MRRGKQRETSSYLVTGIDGDAAQSPGTAASRADSSPCEASPSASTTADASSRPASGSERPNEQLGASQASLRDEVREALRRVLSDNSASAAAKASAGRTLLEYFDDGSAAGAGRRSVELSLEELDAEIARETARLTSSQ